MGQMLSNTIEISTKPTASRPSNTIKMNPLNFSSSKHLTEVIIYTYFFILGNYNYNVNILNFIKGGIEMKSTTESVNSNASNNIASCCANA